MIQLFVFMLSIPPLLQSSRFNGQYTKPRIKSDVNGFLLFLLLEKVIKISTSNCEILDSKI